MLISSNGRETRANVPVDGKKEPQRQKKQRCDMQVSARRNQQEKQGPKQAVERHIHKVMCRRIDALTEHAVPHAFPQRRHVQEQRYEIAPLAYV